MNGDLEPQGVGASGTAGRSSTTTSSAMPPQQLGGPGQTLSLPLPSASDLFQSSRWHVSLRHPRHIIPSNPTPAERFSAALEELQMGHPDKDRPVESFAEMLARLNKDYPDHQSPSAGQMEEPMSKSGPRGGHEAAQ